MGGNSPRLELPLLQHWHLLTVGSHSLYSDMKRLMPLFILERKKKRNSFLQNLKSSCNSLQLQGKVYKPQPWGGSVISLTDPAFLRLEQRTMFALK